MTFDPNRVDHIDTYLVAAIVCAFLNPVFGIFAIIFAIMCRQQKARQNRSLAVLFSDLSFGCSYIGVLASVLIVVLVYAFGHFPAWTYYDRKEIIYGKNADVLAQ